MMPRVAMRLCLWMAAGGRVWNELCAVSALLLCYYFGWRSSTIALLASSDVHIDSQCGIVYFSERFTKGAFQVKSY